MKFVAITDAISNNLDGIRIEHGTEHINFNFIRKHGKREWVDLPTVFDAVNHLFTQLNEEEQEEMFFWYVKLQSLTIHKTGSFESLNEDLEEILLQIHMLLPIEGITAWSKMYPGFSVPEVISSGVNAGNYSAVSSYTSDEYLELCGLSTIFKLSLPLVGSFITDYKNAYADPVYAIDFKEYLIIQLYNGTGLTECAPYLKLKSIVLAKVSTQSEGVKLPMGLVMRGIGVESYPLFYLANDLLRTLCMSETDIRWRDSGTPNNITAKLTRSLDQRQINIDKRFQYSNTIAPNEKAGDDGGNTSIQEDMHAIEKFSSMYGCLFAQAFSNPKLYERYDVDYELYRTFLTHIENYTPTICTGKCVIMGLILSDFAAVESLEHVPLNILNNSLAVCAAFAHKLGHYNIVNYLLAVMDDSIMDSDVRRDAAERTKPPVAIADKFRSYYQTNHAGLNYGMVYLQELVKGHICNQQWSKFTPPKLSEKYGINEQWIPDSLLKEQLMLLVMYTSDLAESRETKVTE